MALGLSVGDSTLEIGTSSFLKAWFSTVSVRLENKEWGSRFPVLMLEFYSGTLTYKRTEEALAELHVIRDELSGLSPDEAVWDFEDLGALPPWGKGFSNEIVSLADYYVTATGRNLFDVLEQAFKEAHDKEIDVVIT